MIRMGSVSCGSSAFSFDYGVHESVRVLVFCVASCSFFLELLREFRRKLLVNSFILFRVWGALDEGKGGGKLWACQKAAFAWRTL